MKHTLKNNKSVVNSLKFVGFEDYLGIGHNQGFSSILVPGSGEANFDTFENNPYQTKKQRQSTEVKMLLEKIPADLITLDPFSVGRIDSRNKNVIEKIQKHDIVNKADGILKEQKSKLKKKMRGRGLDKDMVKEINKNDKVRQKLRKIMEINHTKKIGEKETLEKDLKVLKMIDDEFNPEIYLEDKKENESGSDNE